MRVENAADHPELIETVAEWHWNEWGHGDPTGSLEAWTTVLRNRTRDRIPMTFVAVDGAGSPVGSVTVVHHDMPDRPDLRQLTPWIAGVFVVPCRRGEGIGMALMRHAVGEAGALGVRELFLYTSTARRLYERLGWTVIREDAYQGEQVAVMALRLA